MHTLFWFSIGDKIIYYTTLCKFRNEIVAKKAYELLLKKINKELEKHQAIVKKGVIVGSSITVRPFAPKEILFTYWRVGRKRGKRKSVKEKQV
ncbi:MAG: hypothetical protein ACMUEL_04840 [Flavobacteriales bacterium Tduv]